MKVVVDASACVGHGRCYDLVPELFAEDEEGHCRLLRETVPRDLESKAEVAVINCPEGAIRIEKT